MNCNNVNMSCKKKTFLVKKTEAQKAVLVKKPFLSRNSSFRHGAIIFNGSIYLFFFYFLTIFSNVYVLVYQKRLSFKLFTH